MSIIRLNINIIETNVTIVTLATTQDEILPSWNGFLITLLFFLFFSFLLTSYNKKSK